MRITRDIQWVKMFISSRVRLPWYRLWIRKDEFHHSLSMDLEYAETSSFRKFLAYWVNLLQRRRAAHLIDMEGEKGFQYRKTLLKLLNGNLKVRPSAVAKTFAEEQGANKYRATTKATGFFSPNRSLDLRLDELQLTFEYSGFLWKRWRNKW